MGDRSCAGAWSASGALAAPMRGRIPDGMLVRVSASPPIRPARYAAHRRFIAELACGGAAGRAVRMREGPDRDLDAMADFMPGFAPAPLADGGQVSVLAGLVFLAMPGRVRRLPRPSAALVCLAAIVFVHGARLPRRRAGDDPHHADLVELHFPRAMFGVTGLNPSRALVARTCLCCGGGPDGTASASCPGGCCWCTSAAPPLGVQNGLGHVDLHPEDSYFDSRQIDFKNNFGYIRDWW